MAENLFTKALDGDKKISAMQRMEFKQISNVFNEDLEANLFMGSFALATKYEDIPMESWREFLDYPPTKRIVAELSKDIMLKKAENDIKQGVNVRDNLAVRKSLKDETVTESNASYIIMMLPNKETILNE